MKLIFFKFCAIIYLLLEGIIMNVSECRNLKNTLETEIRRSSNVFIIGHNNPDFDSIGSAVGLYTLARNYRKKAYIIVNDDATEIEPGVKRIIDENRGDIPFITNSEFLELKKDKSLVIITDTNKDYMISINEYLKDINKIIVIDHHEEDKNTIDTDKKFIFTDTSSASEIVGRILTTSKVKYSKEVANFLLAGISLDTKRFKQNTNSKTHDVAEKLIDHGADIDQVNHLFLEEFASAKRVNNLVFTDNFTKLLKFSEDSLSPIQISFTLNRNEPKMIYQREDFAKAADKMLKFEGIDASFALGFVNPNTVHISARSGKRVDVSKILKEVKGECGGTAHSAGGRVVCDDLLKVEQEIIDKVNIGVEDEEEEIIEEPKIIKIKKINRKV